jgi:hypothetical protein
MTREDVSIGNRNALCAIIRTAYEFADSAYQQRVWVGGTGPECSSYVEAVNSLLYDYHAADLIKGEAVKHGFTSEMLGKLSNFIGAVEEFDAAISVSFSDTEIVALPTWEKVRVSAEAFLDISVGWLEQNCADFPMMPWSWAGHTFGGGC